MNFNFNKFRNLSVIKTKEDSIEEVSKAEESESNLEDFMRGHRESPVVKKEQEIREETIEKEEIKEDIEVNPVEEIKDESTSIPEVQDCKVEEPKKEIVSFDSSNYSEYLRDKLNLSGSDEVDFYRPSILQCKPLDFSEIRDTKGIIKSKVADYELRCRLSCIPFSLIGLNNNIVEIQDYTIFKIGGEKYVGSSSRISNQLRMDEYIDKWKNKINSGEEIMESLVIDEHFEGKVVKTLAFNRKELDDLLSLFSKVNATLVSYTDDIKFVAGV